MIYKCPKCGCVNKKFDGIRCHACGYFNAEQLKLDEEMFNSYIEELKYKAEKLEKLNELVARKDQEDFCAALLRAIELDVYLD
uniref:Uncharacterized protein n=1 Tax=viral metagenome TaxID=1070528 RepID=A0A6M3L216_9ZZZZ